MQQWLGGDEEANQVTLPPKKHDFYSRNSGREVKSNTPRTNDTHGFPTNYDSAIGSGRIIVSRNDFNIQTPMSLQTTGPIKPQLEELKQNHNQTQISALAQRVKKSDELRGTIEVEDDRYQYKRKHFRGRKDQKLEQQLNFEDKNYTSVREQVQSYSPARRLSQKKTELNQ